MTDNPFDVDYRAPEPVELAFEAAPDPPAPQTGGPVIHADLIQGSDEWLAQRCGILTASEVKLIMTPTLKAADNDKSRAHVWELAAQRVTLYVEPRYVSDDMLRGVEEEFYARQEYSEKVAPVTEVGFITNDKFGFTVGYSPDGLVGDEGLLEVKSRRQKYQFQTIVEWFRGNGAPSDYLLQCQTGLLVAERKWIDLISYCGGVEMLPMRIYADPVVQGAIVEAAAKFEARVTEAIADYRRAQDELTMFPTERRVEQEMYV